MRDVNYGWMLRLLMQMVLYIFYCCICYIVRGLIYGHILDAKFYGVQECNFLINDITAFLGHILLGDKCLYGELQYNKSRIYHTCVGNDMFYGYGVV